MRYIGLYVWAIVLTIIGFNMFPKIMCVWAVAITFAGFMDRRLQKKRQKKKKIEDEIEWAKYLKSLDENRLEMSETMCRIAEIDSESSPNVKLAKDEIKLKEEEIRRLEDELKSI